MFINAPPFYRRQQAQPLAISSVATRNISNPVGKIAAIRIPAPMETAKMLMMQFRPPETFSHASFPYRPVYTLCLSVVQTIKEAGGAVHLPLLLPFIFCAFPANPARASAPHKAADSCGGGWPGYSRPSARPAQHIPAPGYDCNPEKRHFPRYGRNSRKVSGKCCFSSHSVPPFQRRKIPENPLPRPTTKPEQLHMARCMAAAPQRSADFSRFELKIPAQAHLRCWIFPRRNYL